MFDANKWYCSTYLKYMYFTFHTSDPEDIYKFMYMRKNIISIRWLHINCLPILITQLTTIVNLIITCI